MVEDQPRRDIVVRIDFRIGRRSAQGLMVLAMTLAAVPELASESITLTTYYPAPSGVYAQMITTGSTTLARDGAAKVGIGTATPSDFLEVRENGDVGVNVNSVNGGRARLNLTTNVGSGGWQLEADGSVGNAPSGSFAIVQNGVATRLSIDPNGNLKWAGAVAQQTGCTEVNFTYPNCAGGSKTVCPVGQYVTTISGVMSQYTILQPPYEPGDQGGCPSAGIYGFALCCPCPGGTCPNLP